MSVRAYHFTPLEFGLSNLALRRLKIARLSQLNDPFELIGIDLKDQAIGQAVRKTKEELNERTGVICFSETWHEPLMWSHYAAKHSGICLGFDLATEIVLHIEYAAQRPILTEDDFQGEATGQRNISRLLTLKYAGWSYERELRVGCRLDHNESENGLYFHEFVPEIALREVILGPLCELPTKQIERLAQSIDRDIAVRRTRLDETSFRVVELK